MLYVVRALVMTLSGPAPLYSFCCKGPLQTQDKTFSTEGYISRNELYSVLKVLNGLTKSVGFGSALGLPYTFFGYKFDPGDMNQLKIMIQMCQKRYYALENLSRPSFSTILSRMNPRYQQDSQQDGNPFKLRREICTFLNFLVIRRKAFSEVQLQNLLTGLMKSLATVRQWSSSLQHHCGSKDGNYVSGLN